MLRQQSKTQNVVPADALESCGLWARDVRPRVEFAGWFTKGPEYKCKEYFDPSTGEVKVKYGYEGKVGYKIPFF